MSTDRAVRRSLRTRRGTRAFALLAAPLLLLATSCKVSDVTDPIVEVLEPIVEPLEDLFGLGDGEIATPRFELVNGITIQVVIRLDDLSAGLPITVHLRCAGGTHASGTVVLKESGDISLGQTTFTPGWPAGTDCIVSQEIVQGVEIIDSTVEWLDGNDVRATFENA
jgi:hypothetical protein